MNKQFCPYCMTPVKEGEPCPSCGLTSGAYNPSPHHLPPGTILMDRYMVGRVLGEGGFGITYIGCDLRLELKVAIKEYFPTDKVTRHAMASLDVASYVGAASIGYEEGKVRFLNEARTMARMDKQPEIVSVRDFFEDHNTAYIVMEYVNGTTFKELVSQRGGRIQPEELLPMMEPLFSALTAMHQQGLIHRDISPDNLMLEKGALRLLDFGCARESSRGTETMTIALKHGYAPIEQYQHKGQGPWTDVYALSATIYYCLTGKTPPQALDRLCDDELILPRKLGINITERQEKALLYGMGIRPRRRFQSVEELHAALYIPDGAPVPETYREESPISLLSEDSPIKDEPVPTGEIISAEESPVIETTVSAEETELAPDTEKGERSDDQEPNIPAFLQKHALKAALGAVAILAIVLCVIFLPKNDGSSDQPDSGSTGITTPSDTGDSEAGGEENFDPFAGAIVFNTGSEEDFRAMMADDSVPAVILNSGILLTGEELVITKPLRIAQGHGLNFFAPITVAEGGSILLEAEMCCDALLRCVDGGSIHITSTGFISGSGFLWLEKVEDLIMDEGGFIDLWGEHWSPQNSKHYLTFDAERFFEDAAHVSTFEELNSANEDWAVSSVVVDGDITLPHSFTIQKPVLVTEGVTITSGESETHEFSEIPVWCVNSIFVNHGTLAGSLLLGNWEGNTTGSAVINFGTIDASLHMESNGVFLNYGSVTSSDTHVPSTAIVNLGTLLHAGTIEDGFMDICDFFFNHGEITISGEKYHITIANGNTFFNSGSITVEDHGALNVEAHLISSGSIHVKPTARLDGSGYIEMTTQNASFTAEEGAEVPFCGLMTHNRSSVPDIRAEHNFVTIPFDWCNGGPEWDAVLRHVYNEAQLTQALEDPACQIIAIDCDLELNGDWAFAKNVCVTGSVTVHDGSLTLCNESYWISADTRVENGDIIIEEGSTWLNRSDLRCRELIVRNASFFNTGWFSEVGRISVEGSNFCNVTGSIDLTGRTLTINGRFISLSHLYLHDCEITVSEGAELSSFNGNFAIDSGCRIENHGHMGLHGWEWQEMILNADTVNYGDITFADGVQLFGSLVNHGEIHVHGFVPVNGTVENRGKIICFYGKLYAVDGEITGNPPVAP